MWWGSLSQECCKCSSLLFHQYFLWLWEMAFTGPNSIPRCFYSSHSDVLSLVLVSGLQLWAYRLVLLLLLLWKVLVLWQGNLLAIRNSSAVSVSLCLHHYPPVGITSEFNKKNTAVFLRTQLILGWRVLNFWLFHKPRARLTEIAFKSSGLLVPVLLQTGTLLLLRLSIRSCISRVTVCFLSVMLSSGCPKLLFPVVTARWLWKILSNQTLNGKFGSEYVSQSFFLFQWVQR